MENQSAPERPLPEFLPTDPGRPPGLEFAMGVALFAFTIVVFITIQTIALVYGIIARTPEFANAAFSFSWLEDPLFQQRMLDLSFNGDLVAVESAWSGGLCLALILLTVRLWKRAQWTEMLGLRIPKPMAFLKWFGIFFLILLGIELLAWFVPAFDTDFMEKVVGSTTNMPMLILGVVVFGPLFEEFLLRGLLFGSIRHIADENVAVALTAGVFALMHLQYDWQVMLLILPMGAALGYARVRSGSIWVPVALHMVNNGLSVIWP